MTALPRVSVIIPAKGRAELLAETAASLVSQTLADWEGLIADDGSPPDEARRIAEIAGSDRRFRLIPAAGKNGACAARNRGLAASVGQYAIFLDSDDLLHPGCLDRRVRTMEENPRLDFAVFGLWIFQDRPGDRPVLWNRLGAGQSDLDRFVSVIDTPWNTCSPIWRREALARLGPWDESALSWQDWEFHLRALARGLSYLKIEPPDSYFRLPGRLGAMTQERDRPHQLANRARTVAKVADHLRTGRCWTEARRRMLASHFFELAFRRRQSRRLSLAIWSLGRKRDVVAAGEYGAILASDLILRGVRRAARGFEERLFPNLRRRPQFGLHPGPAPRPENSSE